jgi:CheY-like chemotaxis protein
MPQANDSKFRRDVLLHVEDELDFAELVQRNLWEAGFNHQVVHLTDGEQALAYLKGAGEYADRAQFPLPAVVLLDLKLPRVDGFSVLKWIRQESPFPFLPVYVTTVSEELRDVTQAYRLGANSFVMKPATVRELREMMHSLDLFWLKHREITDSLQDKQQRAS